LQVLNLKSYITLEFTRPRMFIEFDLKFYDPALAKKKEMTLFRSDIALKGHYSVYFELENDMIFYISRFQGLSIDMIYNM